MFSLDVLQINTNASFFNAKLDFSSLLRVTGFLGWTKAEGKRQELSVIPFFHLKYTGTPNPTNKKT